MTDYFIFGSGDNECVVKLYPRDFNFPHIRTFDYVIDDRMFLGVQADHNTFFMEHTPVIEITEEDYKRKTACAEGNAITWFEYQQMLKEQI